MLSSTATVVWFFWILSLGGVDMKESVGQWSDRGTCEEYRTVFVQSYLAQNIPITTSLCTRRYKGGT